MKPAIIPLLLLLLSPSVIAKDYVFLVHGLNGNPETSFGQMIPALQNVYKKRDLDLSIYSFGYQTGNDELSVNEFASSLNDFILEKTGEIAEGDTVNLVGHSQGGLVSLKWLYNAYNDVYPESRIDYFDSFISLGTPYWGTSTTLWPIIFKHSIGKIFGDREAVDMLWGSEAINNMHQALGEQRAPFAEFLNSKNVVNVVANAIGMPNTATGSPYISDDVAVPTTSAKLSHIYSSDGRSYEVEIGKSFYVNNLHSTATKNSKYKNFRSVASIPDFCVEDEECAHDSYQYVWKTLLKEDVEQIDEHASQSTNSFVLDIKLPPNNYFYSKADIGVDLYIDGKPLYQKSVVYKEFNKRQTRVIVGGIAPQDEILDATVVLKSWGFKNLPLKFETSIKPKVTTLLEVPTLQD